MNKASLEILGIDISIGEYNYQDIGFVDSLIECTKDINKKHGLGDKLVGSASDLSYEGFSIKNLGKHCQRGKNHYIFYIKQPNFKADIRIRAHEETHILDSFNQIEILADKLLKHQGIKIDFKEINQREIRAELGAIYALYSRGISPWRLWPYYSGEDWSIANKIYKQSKIPRKTYF